MNLNFLSFAPVFLKELRQIWHSKLLFILLFLALACDIICLFLFFMPVANFLVDSIQTIIQGIIFICSMISSLSILTTSISRWQLERGDPAVDIAFTTPIPPWRIAIEKIIAIVLSNFLIILVVFPVTCLSFIKGMYQDSFSEVISLLPVSLLTLLAVVPISLSSCSSISSKSRVKKSGLSGIVLIITYFAFTGLFTLFKQFNVDNYIIVFGLVAFTFFVLGTSLMISQLSNQKSDRNLIVHLMLLILPLFSSLAIFYASEGMNFEKFIPNVMGIVSFVFIFASLFERKIPSIRQIENCRNNPYLLIASSILSSGAFQCFVLSLISFVIAFTLGKWNLIEYSLLFKFIVYLTIYVFLANVVCCFYKDFSIAKVFVFIVAIAIFLGIIGLFHDNGFLLSMIPWDGENVKLSIDNLSGIYVFAMIGNFYCYKSTIKKYFCKKDF